MTISCPLIFGDHNVLVQDGATLLILSHAATDFVLIQTETLILTSSDLLSIAKPESGWSLFSNAEAIDLNMLLKEERKLMGTSVEIKI